MGLTEPSLFDDDLTMLRDILVNVDLDELRAQHHIRVPYPEDGRPFGAGEFATTSGRVEFVSERLEEWVNPVCLISLPHRKGLVALCTIDSRCSL